MKTKGALSGEEVEALTSELEGRPARRRVSKEPRPFAFGTASARPTQALPALDRMNERLARHLRDLVEPFARSKPRIETAPVCVRSFESWQAEQAEFTSLSLYGMKPLKGGMLIAIDADFIRGLVDAFYGGSGIPLPSTSREFTATEERLLTRVTEGLCAHIGEVWSEICQMAPQLRARETNIAFANLVRGEDAVVVSRFSVSIGAGKPAALDILYPVSALRAVEAQLAAKLHDDGGARGGEWRERLTQALGEVRVEARTVLARPELSVAELMGLSVGDVIPVSLPSLVPLLVENRPFALGVMGEHDGRAALKIEKIDNRSSRT